MTTPIRAVAYYRKSNDDDGESIAQQTEWATDACRQEGVTIVDTFADQSVSGWDTARRSDFAKMLNYCKEQHRLGRPIDAVVCWHPNRFSRSDSLETARFLCELRDAGVHRMFTQSHRWVDFRSSEARMLFSLEQEVGSHRYVRDLAQGVMRGRRATTRKGLWAGGKAPYGYEVVDQKLTLNPAEAETLRWLFTTYATVDTSLRGLCRMLKERGVKSPTGKELWVAETLVKVLNNPTYLGDLVFNRRSDSVFFASVKVRTGSPRRKGAANPEDEWERVKDNHPALVDPETFSRVQKRLAENRTRTTPRGPGHPFLLAGMVKCGHCEKPMIGRTLRSTDRDTGRRYEHRYYVCSRYNAYGKAGGCHHNAVREDRLIPAVTRKLVAGYFNPETLAAIRDEVRRQEQDEAGSGAEPALAARIASVDGKISRAAERLLSEDEDLLPELRVQLRALKAERSKLAAQLDSLQASRSVTESLDDRVAGIMERMNHFQTLLKAADPAAARGVLRELLSHVELWFDHRKAESGKVSSDFARGLIFLNPECLLTSDLSTASARGCCTG